MTETIRQVLTDALQPDYLDIIDNSAAHAGHAGVRTGGGHYQVIIVSAAFENKTLVQRHQLVYKALGDLMKHEIHALSINALSPTEK